MREMFGKEWNFSPMLCLHTSKASLIHGQFQPHRKTHKTDTLSIETYFYLLHFLTADQTQILFLKQPSNLPSSNTTLTLKGQIDHRTEEVHTRYGNNNLRCSDHCLNDAARLWSEGSIAVGGALWCPSFSDCFNQPTTTSLFHLPLIRLSLFITNCHRFLIWTQSQCA